jgi:hypothetical protein
MTSAVTRMRRIAIAIGASLMLAGCVMQPPQGGPTQSDPATNEPATSDPASTDSPAEGSYRYTTDTTGADAWSFEPTGVQVIEADSYGSTAREGSRLVILTLDGEMLQGDEPDFYFQFRVAAYDDETGDYWGLSSGGSFLAERDLFTLGKEPSFEGAEAIFELPNDYPITDWYFLHHSTGEQWFIVVPEV